MGARDDDGRPRAQHERPGVPTPDLATPARESNRRMALALVVALAGLMALLAFVFLKAGLDPQVVP